MSFYLRKAFSYGPFRLNLSKSGLGLSFGVTGLRIGTGPNGPYFHGGRYGLYFKKSLENIPEKYSEPVENLEEPEITPEPQSFLKKLYIYFANFIVIFFIAGLVLTIVTICFIASVFKFAIEADRSSKRKGKRKKH